LPRYRISPDRFKRCAAHRVLPARRWPGLRRARRLALSLCPGNHRCGLHARVCRLPPCTRDRAAGYRRRPLRDLAHRGRRAHRARRLHRLSSFWALGRRVPRITSRTRDQAARPRPSATRWHHELLWLLQPGRALGLRARKRLSGFTGGLSRRGGAHRRARWSSNLGAQGAPVRTVRLCAPA